MRVLTLTTLSIAAVVAAMPASAQRVWRDGHWVERGSVATPPPPIHYPDRSIPDARINPPVAAPVAARPTVSRWGDQVGGRWYAGSRAPGGWNAYRRPVRGWTLPSYWIGGGFWINDWSDWGLSRPPHGYGWLRYYDDAVLADRSGRVWDSVSGIDWARAGGGASATAYAGGTYAAASGGGGGYGASYDAPSYADDRYDARYDDRYEDRYNDRYEAYVGRRPIPAPRDVRGYVPAPCAGPCGAPVRVEERYYGGGYRGHGGAAAGGYYAGGGYYMAGPTVTTIVIQSGATSTTTVTEEVIEEVRETTRYRAPTKVVRRTPSKLVRRSVKDCGC